MNKHGLSIALLIVSLLAAVTPTVRAGLPHRPPEDVGMSSSQLRRIDDVAAEGLAAGNMPGCVVCVGQGSIVFLKAYGHRQVQPTKVPMTVDTVFDMASVTKPVATATSVIMLIERGRIRLHDRVSKHIPEFAQNDKESITVLDLLVHQGGLIPDNALKDYEDGPERAMERIYALETHVEPRTKFVYTDVGFILLAEVVRRISSQDVNVFSQANVFQPLGMRETGFLPREELRQRAAPTEQREGRWMRGEVHDPRAYRLGGIAGHAGLFSTAEDLGIYAQMMLDGGQYQGVRILSRRTVAMMTRAYSVSSGKRGLGWDKQTGYSSNRGELFSGRAFGHGGFTGNAFWIDPELDLFVIFLSNRVHPDGKGSVNPLAGRIGTIASAAIQSQASAAAPAAAERVTQGEARSAAAARRVFTGIDRLEQDDFRSLRGRRVGLITNHTGINHAGINTAKILHDTDQVELVALFSPEHGFAGTLEQSVITDAQDPTTGLTIHSLYGETRRPTKESLQGLDTLMFDIQDIGARFYTYISTMGYAMQAAAEQQLKFVVLDRPNPINGVDVTGPMLDAGSESFVGFHHLPVRHGMTVGELAKMFNAELNLELDLEIIKVEGWQRADFFDASGLLWVNPSPNMRSLTEAVLYPGIGLLETTNLSVGRGTDTPFEVIGAPWLDGQRLVESLNASGLPGVRFVPIRFTPDASKFNGELCGGVNIIITDRRRFLSLDTGLEVARQLRQIYPDDWRVQSYSRLLANEATLEAIVQGRTVAEINAMNQEALEEFLQRRAQYLLYD